MDWWLVISIAWAIISSVVLVVDGRRSRDEVCRLQRALDYERQRGRTEYWRGVRVGRGTLMGVAEHALHADCLPSGMSVIVQRDPDSKRLLPRQRGESV